MANDVIAERVAMFHADCGQFERTLEILTAGHFYPWEIYKGVRLLYVDAWTGKGLQQEQQGRHQEAAASYREVFKYPRNIGVGEPYFQANAEALYRVGCALERAKDKARARRAWQRRQAAEVLAGLLDWADKNLAQGRGDTAGNHYLAGLALKGLGERVKALRHFQAALAVDPGHRRACWEASGFTGE
jgi:tetratricopeptide (TPR) repeat protein